MKDDHSYCHFPTVAPLSSSHSVPLPTSFPLILLNNVLNPFSAANICMDDVGPHMGAWVTSQWPHPQRRMILSQQTTTKYCSLVWDRVHIISYMNYN